MASLEETLLFRIPTVPYACSHHHLSSTDIFMRIFVVPCLLSVLLTMAGCQLPGTSEPTTKTARTIHVAYPSEADLADIPSLMALDLLKDQGYAVRATFFSGITLAVEA